MGATSRRNLYYEHDQNFDPNIVIDVNEYLIESWPQLSLKQRTSVWTLAQSDEDFDFEVIHEQIDNYVYDLAETDDTIELPPEDEDDDDEELDDEEDEDEDDDEPIVYFNILEYLDERWPDLTEDQKQAIIDNIMDDEDFDFETIYQLFDEYVIDYAENVDTSIDLSQLEHDDEDEEDEGEAA